MINIINDSVWIKASELVKEKFGRRLSYRPIKLISDNTETVNNDNFYSLGEDLIIPLKIKSSNLGDIIISHGSMLEPQQKNEISALLKLLIEPKIYSIQLKRTENNLQHAKTRALSLVDSNSVVPLRRSEKFKKMTLSQIILLKSHTELTCNKVALKIHEMTERNLFVHLDDILSSLTSVEDLKTLTDVTIYIRNIELLSKTTLAMLQDYLDLNLQDGPLFLVGSSLSLEAIEQLVFAENLKKELLGFYFDIDRVPLSQQISAEILELLFFRLDPVLS